MLPKYLAGYSGKIFGGIFWQNIWWDILAKYLAEYFGKISFGIFWQSIFHDILAKYLVKYFGKISQRKFLAKWNKIDTFCFDVLGILDVEKQGWWFSQSHPPSFVWWLGPRRLSVPGLGEAMPQQRCSHRFLVWQVWWCQLHRQRQHVQDPNASLCLLENFVLAQKVS